MSALVYLYSSTKTNLYSISVGYETLSTIHRHLSKDCHVVGGVYVNDQLSACQSFHEKNKASAVNPGEYNFAHDGVAMLEFKSAVNEYHTMEPPGKRGRDTQELANAIAVEGMDDLKERLGRSMQRVRALAIGGAIIDDNGDIYKPLNTADSRGNNLGREPKYPFRTMASGDVFEYPDFETYTLAANAARGLKSRCPEMKFKFDREARTITRI